ncbi:MAG TPA: hypothetical protein VGD37_37045 [Kofleriaceae bacterium]
MPATTGIAAVPTGRPGIELQGGIAPGYYLSDATQAPDHKGQGSGHLLALIEPDHWLGTRGLFAGARTSGRHGEDTAEPFLGYRGRLGDGFSLAAIGHGTVVRGADRGASYRAGRVGGELALDARLVAPLRWLELHGQAAVAAMYIDARGTYCADGAGLGVDCNQDSSDRMIDGTVRGVFPAATASLALDVGRLGTGVFHGGRLALVGTAGRMPLVRDGNATADTSYHSVGLTLTLGFGSER